MANSHRRHNFESSILIWLTANSNATQLVRLRQVIDYVIVCHTIDACDECSAHTDDYDEIYIITDILYASNKARVYLYKADNESNNFNEVLATIETDHSNHVDLLGINVVKQSTHARLNNEFLWFQILLNVLFDCTDCDKAKEDFLVKYKEYFEGNSRKEEKIHEFENSYQSNQALLWYSRECFFYEILNKALRTQDIDVLFSLRFFLADLFQQLKAEFHRSSRQNDVIVHHGQKISVEELQILRENIGQSISINSFLSTSFRRDIAEGFSISGNPALMDVIFDIKIQKDVLNVKPFADISALSQYSDEREVLFAAGSLFQVINVSFDPSINMSVIELKLCEENVYELNDIYQWQLHQIKQDYSTLSFTNLLLHLNLLEKAEKQYQRLIGDLSLPSTISCDLRIDCLLGLAKIAERRDEYDIALAYCCLAIEESSDQPQLLIRTYKHMGLTRLKGYAFSEALEYQNKALQIQQEINDAKENIADTLLNFGIIYSLKLPSENILALDYFFQALNLFKDLNMHDEISRCYRSIGEVYQEMHKKRLALQYFQQALDESTNHLPSYHPDQIDALEYIASIYSSMHDYNKALKSYDDVLNAKLKFYPSNDLELAHTYEDIGAIYHKQGNYEKALEMYDKALEIRRLVFPSSHPEVQGWEHERNALQEYVDANPGQIMTYDSMSDDEDAFDSFENFIAHVKHQEESQHQDDE